MDKENGNPQNVHSNPRKRYRYESVSNSVEDDKIGLEEENKTMSEQIIQLKIQVSKMEKTNEDWQTLLGQALSLNYQTTLSSKKAEGTVGVKSCIKARFK